ncbi:hypothetical protein DOTSEDRAFT_69785 [Dothistroma septosporum NZE10]|uniref:3-hydroxyisobutyrate dehydrogenase n=1 Tax=Dothistroma septosporum (strain NZE10 / CBS 128990) TaxID=675120 RepID=N1PYA3_DOTSN|nr:hypothetical protein DOTSEDRAFT_69785 [Dothistroma septosporum NZE10]
MEESIAFIGIGAMGYGMASNIRRNMSTSAILYINDPNADACKKFILENSNIGPVEPVATAMEAAKKATIIITMVPRPEHVREIYLDASTGVLAAAAHGNLSNLMCIESSTIDPATTRSVGKALTEAGVGTYIDAPVSGGIAGAADGNLAFMIGHSTPHPRIQNIISLMANSDKIFFCGPLGSGLTSKICNNYLSGTINIALSESLALGLRSGVDPKVLFEVIKASSGQNWMLEHHNPVPGLVDSAPSSRGYERSFPIPLMIKDLSLGVTAAEEVGVEPSMARRALETYQRASEDKDVGELDYTAVYRLIDRDA